MVNSSAGVVPLQPSGVSLPSSSQLDNFINSADIVSIKQLVQSVVTGGLSCAGKTQYLSDLLARMQTCIAIRSSQLSQLQGVASSQA